MKRYFTGFSFILLLMIITIGALNVYLYRPDIAGNNGRENMTTQIENVVDDRYAQADINSKKMEGMIKAKSEQFVKAAFAGEEKFLNKMLDNSASYVRNDDGSGFIRYIGDTNHVEGYMATDSTFEAMKQRWCVAGDGDSILSCMEIKIGENSEPIYWYLHFRECAGEWKLYMLENDI